MSNIITTIKFATAPTTAVATVPTLKYNKKNWFSFEMDDMGDTIPFALSVLAGKSYTDGCGNNKPYTMSAAVNGANETSGIEYSMTDAIGARLRAVIAAGGDLSDHGYFHDPVGFGADVTPLQSTILMQDFIRRKFDGYEVRSKIVPTNYAGHAQAAFDQGYLYSTSQGTFDDFTPEWMYAPPGTFANLGSTFATPRRDFSDNWQGDLTYLKGVIDSVNSSTGKFYRIGSHYINNEAAFQEFFDYVQTTSNDELLVATTREVLEYREMRNLPITQNLVGDTLTITVDTTNLSSKSRWRDLSFLIDSDSDILSVITTATSSTFNPSTGLVNTFQQYQEESVRITGKIPFNGNYFYQDNAAVSELDKTLFTKEKDYEGVMAYGQVYKSYKDYYIFPEGMDVVLSQIKLGDGSGSFSTLPFVIKAITEDNEEVLVYEFTGEGYNEEITYNLPTPLAVKSLSYFIQADVNGNQGKPTYIQLFGEYTSVEQPPLITIKYPFGNMIGVNGFSYTAQAGPRPDEPIYDQSYDLIKDLGSIRLYLDCVELVREEHRFRYKSNWRGFNTDEVFTKYKADNVFVNLCIQGAPKYVTNTWVNDPNNENLIRPFGTDKDDVNSYSWIAKIGFQVAARYGRNTNIDLDLIEVDTQQEPWEEPSGKLVGLDLITLLEFGNEVDKWWEGGDFNPSDYNLLGREYAYYASAVYDGHKGTMGNNVGVKTADPTMQVTNPGLASFHPDFLFSFVEECKKIRGFKEDGSVDIPLDGYYSFHTYPNTAEEQYSGEDGRGMAVEQSAVVRYTNNFQIVNQTQLGNKKIVCGETGYDLSPNSPLKAVPPTGSDYTIEEWAGIMNLRTALFFCKAGVYRNFFFTFEDDGEPDGGQFSSCGIIERVEQGGVTSLRRRATANALVQTNSILKDFIFVQEIASNPCVDKYQNGSEIIYALYYPTEVNQTGSYNLTINGAVEKYELNLNGSSITKTNIEATGSLALSVNEKPIFIKLKQGESGVRRFPFRIKITPTPPTNPNLLPGFTFIVPPMENFEVVEPNVYRLKSNFGTGTPTGKTFTGDVTILTKYKEPLPLEGYGMDTFLTTVENASGGDDVGIYMTDGNVFQTWADNGSGGDMPNVPLDVNVWYGLRRVGNNIKAVSTTDGVNFTTLSDFGERVGYNTLGYWGYNGSYSIMSNLQYLEENTPEPITPDAPTLSVTNDVAKTMNWTNNPLYTNLTDYEQTLNGGTTITNLSAKPINVGNTAKGIGQVGVRVKAASGRNASNWLFNTEEFTYTPPVEDDIDQYFDHRYTASNSRNANDSVVTHNSQPLTLKDSIGNIDLDFNAVHSETVVPMHLTGETPRYRDQFGGYIQIYNQTGTQYASEENEIGIQPFPRYRVLVGVQMLFNTYEALYNGWRSPYLGDGGDDAIRTASDKSIPVGFPTRRVYLLEIVEELQPDGDSVLNKLYLNGTYIGENLGTEKSRQNSPVHQIGADTNNANWGFIDMMQRYGSVPSTEERAIIVNSLISKYNVDVRIPAPVAQSLNASRSGTTYSATYTYSPNPITNSPENTSQRSVKWVLFRPEIGVQSGIYFPAVENLLTWSSNTYPIPSGYGVACVEIIVTDALGNFCYMPEREYLS